MGPGALAQAQAAGPVALLHDRRLPDEWVERARQALQPSLVLPVRSGEAGKSMQEVTRLLSALAEAGLPRSGAIMGLGGGATTDVAGFVAATYLRGVRYFAAPTTLLSMVDAAVGGKTGVNLPEGKNLVGAFWPAEAVWCDTDTLDTLPVRDFRSGAAEVFKHGLLAAPELLDEVLPSQRSGAGLTQFSQRLPEVVRRAVQVKADIVARDPTEQSERAFLNLGHTLAHALETFTHQRLPHGEAVGYGMHFAALLSEAHGAKNLSGHTHAFLNWQNPEPLPRLSLEALWPIINRDKKADTQGPRWVLLHELGQPYLTRVDRALLDDVFRQWQRDI
ncbi:3-dehydroquinate synthase [Deinococcus radiophilus]|uniref:3-dehydroquinate synthase n=1 Tax=Deinococcus radiophilus TaxID=32062 RepID=UPI002D795FD2|nr:3-dehydroquinate synthase [Deinococcus radiophilus]